MKVVKLMSKEGMAIVVSILVVVIAFLVISQMYFTYSESRAMSTGCYDKGGSPTIEKTRLSITYFDCDMNP